MLLLEQESSKQQQEDIVNINEMVEEKREEPSRIVEQTEAKEVVIDNILKSGKKSLNHKISFQNNNFFFKKKII